jgi:TonB family protein
MRALTFAACLLGAVTVAGADLEPAQLVLGEAPQQPSEAVCAGEVFLELTVGAEGMVRDVRTLRHTPPFTSYLRWTVAGWRFAAQGHEWRTLVAGVFRSPTLRVPTQGEPPHEVAAASRGIVYPTRVVEPEYPVHAVGDGVTVLQVEVADDGSVKSTSVIRSAGVFDAAAISAARRWLFRPVNSGGQTEPAVAFLVFGFREPVTGSPPAAQP